MKTLRSIIILAAVFFVVLTLATMKNEAASDGVDAYGFPFTFYDRFEGKCDGCYDKFGFKPLYLLADICVAVVFASLLWWLWNYRRVEANQ